MGPELSSVQPSFKKPGSPKPTGDVKKPTDSNAAKPSDVPEATDEIKASSVAKRKKKPARGGFRVPGRAAKYNLYIYF